MSRISAETIASYFRLEADHYRVLAATVIDPDNAELFQQKAEDAEAAAKAALTRGRPAGGRHGV